MKRIYAVISVIMFSLLLIGCKTKEFEVVINVNDDNKTIIEKKVKHGELIKEPEENFIKETYEFSHWLNKETNKEFTFDTKITKDTIIEGIWKEDGIRRGTFNREYPSYYEVGKELIDDAKIVYINFDGFARYYFDEALKRDPNSLPNFKAMIDEGVFFEDLRTTTPSITNPTQNMIISGATTSVTKNVYRYYDRDKNIVVQQQRENESETIIDKVLEADMSVASVSFYLAEAKLSTTDPTKIYVYNDSTNPKVAERGPERYGDYFSRFEQAQKLLTKQEFKTSGQVIKVDELPKLTMIYADDLDALGHNDRPETGVYGQPNSLSEEERLTKVVNYLVEMDEKIGEFIQATKDAGVYDELTFILTTDHGMTPFGSISGSEGGKYMISKIADLAYALRSFNKKFELQKVEPEERPNSRTTVVGVGMNLNLQLTFLEEVSDEELEQLKERLLEEEYVGVVKTRKELEEEGYWTYAADMIVSPSERYHFAPNVNAQYRVRGQHDSYLDSSNHIFGVVWGKGIKEGYVYKERAYNYDFGITMAAMLGLDLPKANGIVLDIFEERQRG